MKAVGFAVAVVGLAALAAGIVAGGQSIGATRSAPDSTIEIEDIPLDVTDEADGVESNAAPADVTTTVASVSAAVEPAAPEAVAPKPTMVARTVSPADIVPPEIDFGGLERIGPRQPLSELALALPPKPEMPADWDGTVLYRPMATSSARFDSMGRTIAIAGTEGVEADETCAYAGESWNCGVRARTAFRLFLRGRAPTCDVPPEADREIILANCRMGKQDIGKWLVENGWARAVLDGPYAEVAETAKAGKKGIFGPPPALD